MTKKKTKKIYRIENKEIIPEIYLQESFQNKWEFQRSLQQKTMKAGIEG